jgi:transposase-like protein
VLHSVAGEVNLKVPKLRRQTFETAIIERYRRRESSVEEALIEMYLAGISGPVLESLIAVERAASPGLNGRSVFGWESDLAGKKAAGS